METYPKVRFARFLCVRACVHMLVHGDTSNTQHFVDLFNGNLPRGKIITKICTLNRDPHASIVNYANV